MRGGADDKRSCFVSIIDSLLGSSEMILPRSPEPIVRGLVLRSANSFGYRLSDQIGNGLVA